MPAQIIVTPQNTPKMKGISMIVCEHCKSISKAYSGNYCSIICLREAFFGSPWWQG